MTVQQYLAYFDEMMTPTEPLFRMFREDQLGWKPTEKSFSAAQLMTHIAASFLVYGHGIASGNWGFASMRELFVANRRTASSTIDESVAALHANYREFRNLIGGLSESEFNEGEIDSPQLGRVPRWRAAMLAMEHHASHKAELFMYLKMIGEPVHTGHLYSDRRNPQA